MGACSHGRRNAVLLIVALGMLGACSTSDKHRGAAPSLRAPTSAAIGVRNVDVTVGRDDLALPGTLVLPSGRGPFPAIVFVSGSGPNDRDETVGPNHPFRDLADGLASHGIATLRYDKATKVHPQSIDLQTFTPTQEYVPDAVAAVQLLRERADIDPRRIVVLGHSQGGTFAPKIASTEPLVSGIILLAAAAAPFGATLLRQTTYLAGLQPPAAIITDAQLAQLRGQAALIDDPELPLTTPAAALPGGIGSRYWLDLTHLDPVATARSLAVPILLLQGERDYQVTVADDLVLWERGLAGREGVTEKRYRNANHLFLDGEGPPNPAEYSVPGTLDPALVSDIASWMASIG